jgi:hypothetical protein
VHSLPPGTYLSRILSPAKAERSWRSQTRKIVPGSPRSYMQASKTGSPECSRADPQRRRGQYNTCFHHAHQPFVQSFACTNVQVPACTFVQVHPYIGRYAVSTQAKCRLEQGLAENRAPRKATGTARFLFGRTEKRLLARIGPEAADVVELRQADEH